MDDRRIHKSQKIPKKADAASADQEKPERSYVQMLYNDLCRFADVIVENAASHRLGVHKPRGAESTIPKPQKIPPPKNDEISRAYNELQRLARSPSFPYTIGNPAYSHTENTRLFLEQAVLMCDFADNYELFVPYHPPSPTLICYQRMDRDQLRTYFSWRREVREGTIKQVSIAYALLYVYELINLVGAENSRDGFYKILSLWREFRKYDVIIDAYVPDWLVDYYIMYLPDMPLAEFLAESGLGEYYSRRFGVSGEDTLLKTIYSVSKYNVRESAYYKSEGGAALMDKCLTFVINHLEERFESAGTEFLNSIYRLTRTGWKPFRGAPFHQRTAQPDRVVELSPTESYICKNGRWFHKSLYAMDSGRKLAAYTVKCTESALRRAVKYKRNITANPDMLDYVVTRRLKTYAISLEEEIVGAVTRFLAEKNRTVITVDQDSLNRIRHESLEIQEKLIVPDSTQDDFEIITETPVRQDEIPTEPSDVWQSFADLLTDNEKRALQTALSGGDFRRAADEGGVMAEVLVESINEKAYDTVGDGVMDFDGAAEIFDEYRDKLTEVLM